MEINKQLFEDVLSGKLKGTFVLRDGSKISSYKLSIDTRAFTYPIFLNERWYTYQGEFDLVMGNHPADIIDFIPDTNMKENELTIEIPDGKTVDWDESKKQNKIVLKDKSLTYEDVCKKMFQSYNSSYYICGNGNIVKFLNVDNFLLNANNAATKHQLECILAKNKLANVAKYLNDGWKPWHDKSIASIVLLVETKTGVSPYEVINGSDASYCGSIWFKSKDLARQAIEILGEETVKLALEPLGI